MSWLGRFWAALLLCLLLTGQGLAQDNLIEDFDRWTRLAEQAETAVDSENGDEQTLQALRSQIVNFRSQFEALSSQNAARIATLREQLEALGPRPEGEAAETEASEVTAKRQDLQDQLNTLLLPVQRAEAEFVRANSLVRQIDDILRERQTDELLSVSPTPLNPAHWQPAFQDLIASALTLRPEMSAQARQQLSNSAPVAVGLTVLGLVLIFRGRLWSMMVVERLQRLGPRGFGIWRFLVSLLRIVLPFAGLVVLSLAAITTELLSREAEYILMTIVFLSGIMLGIRWISERVFSRDDDEALILLSSDARGKIRFNVWVITLSVIVAELMSNVLEAGSPQDASLPVLLFVPFLISCIALYRIGKILRGYSEDKAQDDTTTEFRASTLSRVVRGLGTGAVAVACVTPLLIAAGYVAAADALMPPYIMTLALLGLVMTLQRFLADVYGAVTKQGEAAREALLPVIFGLVLLLLVAPVLALVWGARVTDLTELWAAIGRGIAFGESRISPSDFFAFAVIFAIGYVVTRLLQSALKSNVLPKTRIDIGGQNAIVSGLGYVGIFLAALAAITGAGLDLSSLAIVAGALSVGIGFGLQNIVSNFVSGIILLIERPISEGDWIEVGDKMGYVRDISVRSTRIETFDRTDVIVPNADLVSGTVTNYTRGNTVGRVIVPVGVAYGTDTKRIEDMLREIAEAHPMVLASPAPAVLFTNFGADALEFEVRCFLRDVNWMMMVKSDMNHAIAKKFGEEGIEIPFAQRDVWLRTPETLTRNDVPETPEPGEPE